MRQARSFSLSFGMAVDTPAAGSSAGHSVWVSVLSARTKAGPARFQGGNDWLDFTIILDMMSLDGPTPAIDNSFNPIEVLYVHSP